jgi:hypothetical protein
MLSRSYNQANLSCGRDVDVMWKVRLGVQLVSSKPGLQ